MKLSALALVVALQSAAAFVPQARSSQPTFLKGYLDDLSAELNGEDPNPNPEEESRENTKMAEKDKDRSGVGNWDSYVEFDEFDGGDGQMGVAGDGEKGLSKFDMSEIAKSKSMSAKNAWGTSSGYGDKLRSEGMDTQRAQQLENWNNQQEVLKKRQAQRYLTEDFDNDKGDDDNWRNLASFGVERNQVRRNYSIDAFLVTGGNVLLTRCFLWPLCFRILTWTPSLALLKLVILKVSLSLPAV
jgi:hypothetical protein